MENVRKRYLRDGFSHGNLLWSYGALGAAICGISSVKEMKKFLFPSFVKEKRKKSFLYFLEGHFQPGVSRTMVEAAAAF